MPDYSPYGFGTAIPSMLLSHMAGASFVEAAITALGVGYLQKSFPEILTRRPARRADSADGARVNPWCRCGAFTALASVVVFRRRADQGPRPPRQLGRPGLDHGRLG